MLSVSAPPISMNRSKHECFPHHELGPYPNALISLNDQQPTTSVIESRVHPILRDVPLDSMNIVDNSKQQRHWVKKIQDPAPHPPQSSLTLTTDVSPTSLSSSASVGEQPTEVLPEPCLRRSVSLPSLGRRSIFGNYWEKRLKPEDSPAVVPSSGIPIVPPPSLAIPEGVDWHHFSPPPAPSRPTRHVPLVPHSKSQTSSSWINNDNEGSIVTRRYHRDIHSVPVTNKIVTIPATRGGVYPLCSPRSILRRKSERSNTDPSHMLNFLKEESKHRRDESDSSDLPFALTKSIKQLQRKQSIENLEAESDEETGSSYSSSTGKRIQFNPLVLVTEFEDNGKREWFSERELQKFQLDAIAKARAYLHSRPRMAEEYNQLKLCPVTGTMRKKALFSLPVLSSIVEDCLPKVFSAEFQTLLEKEVQNLLIVEPNKTVRDLFCRCLHSLFPRARIYGATSGEEALKLIRLGLSSDAGSSHKPIDLVIVAEKLSRCRQAPSPPGTDVNRKTIEADCSLEPSKASPPVVSPPQSPSGMSAYEFLQQVGEAEDERFSEELQKLPETPELSVMRKSLLIAVTLNVSQDADRLKASGADVVWGIPPPAPCTTLRHQLLFALVAKRRFPVCSEDSVVIEVGPWK